MPMETGVTLTALRAAVRARGFDQLSDATIDAAVNDGQLRILSSFRWPFMTDTSTATGLLANVAAPPWVLGVGRTVDAVVYFTSASNRYALQYLSPAEFYALQAENDISGEPEFWTVTAGAIVLHPIPATTYSLEYRYHSSATTLTAGSDTTRVPVSFRHVVVSAACVVLAQRQRDWNMKASSEQDLQSGLKEMRDFYGTSQRQNSTTVAASGFYDPLSVYDAY